MFNTKEYGIKRNFNNENREVLVGDYFDSTLAEVQVEEQDLVLELQKEWVLKMAYICLLMNPNKADDPLKLFKVYYLRNYKQLTLKQIAKILGIVHRGEKKVDLLIDKAEEKINSLLQNLQFFDSVIGDLNCKAYDSNKEKLDSKDYFQDIDLETERMIYERNIKDVEESLKKK